VREGLKSRGNSKEKSREQSLSHQSNITDEGKIRQRISPSIAPPHSSPSRTQPHDLSTTSDLDLDPRRDLTPDLDVPDDGMFQVVTQAELERSRSSSDYASQQGAGMPDNMTSSILLSGTDLLQETVNSGNSVWIKPGATFAVPVAVEKEGAALTWEFSSQPKDIVFSVTFQENVSSESEIVVSPCKCDSHKQTVHGELCANKPGVYTLVFDNTYSRLTSKQVTYSLGYSLHPESDQPEGS